MATVFAVGVMSLPWMLVLTAMGCAEQLLPKGDRIGKAFGAALAVWGIVRLLR
jgi:predicted metal-binding membrane protein